MPQSLACLQIHLVFSTKNRASLIPDSVRDSLHGYLATILQNLGCPTILINSVEDHIHLLFNLSRTVSVSQVVENLKKSSSKWIKTQAPEFTTFAWQSGYGAFAVSETMSESVCKYIANQREHHCKVSFQEEFRKFLKRHRIIYDEKYVWE